MRCAIGALTSCEGAVLQQRLDSEGTFWNARGLFPHTHKKTTWAAIILLSLVFFVVICLSFFNWNALRPALGRVITAKIGRAASIDGDLKIHLWSWNPTAEVNGLRLKNPNWADNDLVFGANRVLVHPEASGRLMAFPCRSAE
jgi:hypothetical protein